MRADSAGKGRGAAFTIQLPTIFTQDISEKRDVPSDGLSRKFKTAGGNQTLQNIAGVRLLIVDDNQDTTNLLAATLVDKKALVQTANSVSEALETLKWYSPQVLISDLAMPDEDGYSFISKVRQFEKDRKAKIRAIALTALVRVQDRARALSAGFDMFVPKPVEPAELMAAIAHLLEPEPTSKSELSKTGAQA